MPGIVVLNFQADKQALQEELTRRLRQKDEEIAVLSSENEVGGVWLHNYFVWIWKDTSYCTLSITSQIDISPTPKVVLLTCYDKVTCVCIYGCIVLVRDA